MRRLLILTVLLCELGISYAQNSPYNDPSLTKTSVFTEDFSNNAKNWWVGDSPDITKRVQNGHYYMKGNRLEGTWGNWLIGGSLLASTNGDFEIETSVKLLSNSNQSDQNFFGFMYGFVRNGPGTNYFGVSNYGYYLAYTYTNNQTIKSSNWQASTYLNRGGWNKLTVRKIGRKNSFYLNNQLVHEEYDIPMFGQTVGIIIPQGSEVLVDYLNIYSFDKLQNQPPEISIYQPAGIVRGFKSVQSKLVTVAGRAIDADGLFEVTVNGREASLSSDGSFSASVPLVVGENEVTIKATDGKMLSATKTIRIQRNASEVVDVLPSNTSDLPTLGNVGNYYALIIGINNYQDGAIGSLDQPVSDAEKLYQALTTQYTFSPSNVTLLKDPGYVDIISAFDQLTNKVTEKDNLLVFYAGHGWWDEERELGYWLPSDARKSNTAFWLRNSTISDYIGSIKSKHTLLVADACFGGSIFKTRAAFADAQPSINKLYELSSRKAMTSGTLKEVPDKSVFLEYLVKRLNTNQEAYLSAEKLFGSFREAVLNNSPNVPQYGTVQNAGDEGGDFIFIRK